MFNWFPNLELIIIDLKEHYLSTSLHKISYGSFKLVELEYDLMADEDFGRLQKFAVEKYQQAW